MISLTSSLITRMIDQKMADMMTNDQIIDITRTITKGRDIIIITDIRTDTSRTGTGTGTMSTWTGCGMSTMTRTEMSWTLKPLLQCSSRGVKLSII